MDFTMCLRSLNAKIEKKKKNMGFTVYCCFVTSTFTKMHWLYVAFLCHCALQRSREKAKDNNVSLIGTDCHIHFQVLKSLKTHQSLIPAWCAPPPLRSGRFPLPLPSKPALTPNSLHSCLIPVPLGAQTRGWEVNIPHSLLQCTCYSLTLLIVF